MAADLMHRRARCLTMLTVSVLIVPAAASPASAHAAVVSSDPDPGAVLSTAPGVVTLEFSEPLNVDLSTASVAAPDDARFEGEASASRILIPLTTNAPGVYRVEWSTVSTLDGHPLSGSFAFGVGVAPGAAGEASVTLSPRRGDLLVGLLRAAEYIALLLAVGMLLVRRLARRAPSLAWARPRLRMTLVFALVAGTVVVLAEAVIASPSPSAGSIVTYVTTGSPGAARLLRVGAEGTAVIVAFSVWRWTVMPVSIAVVALAGAGHAAAVDPTWLGVAADSIHLAAAGMWAGGVLALATVRPPTGWRDGQGRRLLDRFSPVAIPAFLVTVATGALRGFQELARPADLITTSYGRTLTLKIAAVVVMAQLSVLAWRRVIGSFRAEAVMAVVIVGLAALLAAYPLPPARTAEAEELAESSGAEISALPEPGDLTLGGAAGQVLVGLTLRPARPGSNETLVYLLPLDGEEAAAGLSAAVAVDDGLGVRMEDCGATCRRAELDLSGGEEISVEVGGPGGGTALFRLPELPAPNGEMLLRSAQNRIHELASYRLEEVLSSGLATVLAEYEFVAPDRARIEVDEGSTSVFLGSTRYVRSAPGGPWEVISEAPPLAVPRFLWDSFKPWTDALVVGEETVNGAATRIVTFFGSAAGTPAWFRLWVGPGRLVVRAEMRAQGHFMDHLYYDFDAPIEIRPPAEVNEE